MAIYGCLTEKVALIGTKLREVPSVSKHIPLRSPEACLQRKQTWYQSVYLSEDNWMEIDFCYTNAPKRFNIYCISDIRNKQRDLPDSSVNSRFNSTFILLSSSSSFGLKQKWKNISKRELEQLHYKLTTLTQSKYVPRHNLFPYRMNFWNDKVFPGNIMRTTSSNLKHNLLPVEFDNRKKYL